MALVALAALLLAGCGEEEGTPSAPDGAAGGDPGIVHVHGLGRNPADGSLLIATHTGLFRVAAGAEAPVRVAGHYQDTMGFTVLGPDHFLGSGHPADVQKDPPFLGLIESRDGGERWRPISLRGKVDFHVLEALGRTVYGFGSDFDTREPRFLRSHDSGRTWSRLAPPEPLLGLAIDPSDARHVVALGEERGYVSRDAGDTWRPLDIPGGLVTWTRELGVVAADLAGVLRRADAPDSGWDEVGSLDGTPAALEGVGRELLAATHEGAIVSSRDGGQAWHDVLSG